MAQLKSTVITGTLEVTQNVSSARVYTNRLVVPETSGSSTYGLGTAGQIIMSNGSTSYWGTVPTDSTREAVENKVVSLSSASTDSQYPSAKCVYDLIGDVETLLAAI